MKLLLFSIFLTSCVASTKYNQTECRRINDTMIICRDIIHSEMCRIKIDRLDPYNDTTTEKFWCKDTGYFDTEIDNV